jgi:UDPglucose 6-dehydrogenase/GDP-mannose 6-dehydrogenase
MKIGIIGCGYVGLTTGICLSSIGHTIHLYDIDHNKLKTIKEKKMPFFELGLEELLIKNLEKENLKVDESLEEFIKNTDCCFVCVGTPSNNSGTIDLQYIESCIKNIVESLKQRKKEKYLIIIRSTIVPSTTRNKVLPILTKGLENSFQLAVVPEFLREGKALSDFMNPDKIVIGSLDIETNNLVKSIFNFFENKAEFIQTNLETAEMIKYTNNAFLATLISFSNEVANISEEISGVDSFEVMNALIADKRITTTINNQKIIPGISEYLSPGCGFGGSCFPKDVNAIVGYASSIGAKTPLLDAVLSVNNERSDKIISLSKKILSSFNDKKIAVLGLAFKPDTDDMRSSPAIEVIKKLQALNCEINAYDPKVNEDSLNSMGISGINITENIESCLNDVDLAILLTKWEEFSKINGAFLKKHMKKSRIIDGRGFLDKSKFENNTYYKIGLIEKS